MLRMSPFLSGEWIRHAVMPVYIGGAELNVANALAKWNMPVQYFSAVPDNYLSKEIMEYLSKNNLDISPVHFSGNRIGSYYLPQGADLKNTSVIYDRAHSSFSELKPGTINWDMLLKDAEWFHFSAISPALNTDAAVVCKEALYAAIKNNLTVSVDLNYRSKLWQYGKQPVEIMPELVQCCDVIMGNIWSANSLLGTPLDENIHFKKSKAAYLEHAFETGRNIMNQFPKCKTVANTFRFDSGEGIKYFAALEKIDRQYVSSEFYTETVVDKVGSGDCFMAGLIYGLINRHQSQNVINFAAAAAAAKFQEKGDFTKQTVEQVQALIK